MENQTHVARLWRWSGDGPAGTWIFATIDGEVGEALSATAFMRRLETGRTRGFGSLRVTACIGESRWQTSVFPQKGEGWLLPIKAAVRRAEGIGEGDSVAISLEF